MARLDFIPRTDGDFLAWMQNFKTQASALAATLGLTAGDTAAIGTDLTSFQAKFDALTAAKAAQQATAADKAATRAGVVGRTRALANRIKAHANFTTAFGEQLGILGPEDTTDLTTSKPTLKATTVQTGNVTLAFNKSIATGVRISSKRGAEATFSFLAVDTESPYVDTRPNLAAGPESRMYQAQYLEGDDLVGLLSDIVAVTVPG